MSCSGRIHQFPRNVLSWQAPGCIQLYSFKSMGWIKDLKKNSKKKKKLEILKSSNYLKHVSVYLSQTLLSSQIFVNIG
jgi:hypothetical protein